MKWLVCLVLTMLACGQVALLISFNRESRELNRRISALEARDPKPTSGADKLLVAQVHPTKYTEHTWTPECDLGRRCTELELAKIIKQMSIYGHRIAFDKSKTRYPKHDQELESAAKDRIKGLTEDVEHRGDESQQGLLKLAARFVDVCTFYGDALGIDWGTKLLQDCKAIAEDPRAGESERQLVREMIPLLERQLKLDR